MNSARSHLFALFLPLLLASTSCRVANETASNGNTAPETIVSTTPPFQTREPDRYQATRTITIVTAKGETTVIKTLIARDGPLRREESDAVVNLQLPEGSFVLLPGQQVYAAVTAEDKLETEDDENFADFVLHSDEISATYQSLGTAIVNGRSTKKYLVVNNRAVGNVSHNETLIWIDEDLSMPIMSETKSGDGTRTTMELSDITLATERELFQIPANFEKIAFRELWKQLRSARLNP